jgi:hypothetical protein
MTLRSQLFSRLPADKKEYYFLRRTRVKNTPHLDYLIMVDPDKEKVFNMLNWYESQGVACYVEDREGKRLS